MLFETNDFNRNRSAIVDEYDNTYTYGELEKRAEYFAGIVPKRSVVIIKCYRDIETLSFYYCMMYNHVVPIMIAPDIDKQLLDTLISTYQPQFMWQKSANEDMAGKYVYMNNGYQIIKLNDMLYPVYDELALLLSTSGSTGSPKLVRLSYNNIISNTASGVRYFEYTGKDTGVTTLPVNYCYGLSTVHCHWYVGGCIFVTDRTMLDDRYWSGISKWNVTNIEAVPYNFEMIKRIRGMDKIPDTVRFMMSGGGVLSRELAELVYGELRTRGITFYLGYGQTEATTFVAFLKNEMVQLKAGSVGMSLPDIKAECGGARQDELILQGGNVCLGYAENIQQLSDGDIKNGILNTGDYAYIDSDGYIFLKGRKSRFIKVLGARYSLDDIEMLLNRHFMDADIICVGRDDLIKVGVVGDIAENSIIRYCEQMLSIHKKMISVEYLDKLPRAGNGKIQYSKIRL